jgi:DNA-binding NarL/FixJ family response regulator
MRPGLGGFGVIRRVVQVSPKTAVVTVSNYTEQPCVQPALRSGALGSVDKLDCSMHLAEAVRVALAGQCDLSPSLSREQTEKAGVGTDLTKYAIVRQLIRVP